jgi:hypothetical protein
MHDFNNFHIPMPSFEPSQLEKQWALDNIKPHVDPAVAGIETFERIDLLQNLFDGWSFTQRIRDHFAELEIGLHKLAVFLSNPNPSMSMPHIDGAGGPLARVCRFNIPIIGLEPIYIEWWNKGVDSPEVTVRNFKEFRNGQFVDAVGLKTENIKEPPVFKVTNPGPCWNRTELVHRLDLSQLKGQRFVITAQLPNDKQISWDDLVERLAKLGYL